MINVIKFTDACKAQNLFKSYTKQQVAGIDAIIKAFNEFSENADLPLTYMAYMLATAYIETASTMSPIEEYGKGKGRVYGTWHTNSKGEKYAWTNERKNKAYTFSEYPHLFYGRGLVQLTWLDNYVYAGKKLGVDFAKYPASVMEPKHAADIMILGMTQGWFTGKKLSDYINSVHKNYKEARRIINGTDRAAEIAGYAQRFEAALKASKE